MRKKYPADLNTKKVRASLQDYARLFEMSKQTGLSMAESLHKLLSELPSSLDAYDYLLFIEIAKRSSSGVLHKLLSDWQAEILAENATAKMPGASLSPPLDNPPCGEAV